LAEILVKANDIHEGLWGVYIEFGFTATNITPTSDPAFLTPAAVATVQKIGLQRFPASNNLTVDAAVVNPRAKTGRTSK
ncbi:MAG TPA: hypothetical protein VMT34_11455, partial [Aggregatilineales bacterium]|nr:hypothetical protein [Aggregatilineales bacterium]